MANLKFGWVKYCFPKFTKVFPARILRYTVAVGCNLILLKHT